MPRASEIGLAAVAKRAGVSAATVSNTLNRPDIVAPATRERVLDAIAQLDFVPNRAAAVLRQGTSRLLGLVIPDIVNPFYSAITRGVTEAAAAHGYVVALCVSHDDPDRELVHFGHLAEIRAVGAIVAPLSAEPSRLSRLRTVGARLILVDRSVSVEEGCSVAIDDVRGGYLAVEHLIRTRQGRIALVNGPRSIPQCEDRRAGARAALADHDMDPESLLEITVDAMTIDEGTAVGASLAADPPAAVFCTNDQLAIGVMRGLSGRGVRVPEDVAVVGYGDLELARDSLVPLTSIAQPKDELGRAAVEELVAEIETASDEHRHAATMFEPTLVVRQSAPAR